MPKLLQINVTANWGSTGKIAEQIGLSAIHNGWESYIAYGRWANPSKSHLIKVGSKLDTYLHYGRQRIFDTEGLESKGPTKRLISQIDFFKPDVIHLHNIHDHYLNYKLLFEYLNNTNIKVVWTFHDCWAFTGHCFHFITKNCSKWINECNKCPLVHEYPNTLFDRSKKNFALKKELFSANKNLTIVACSDWLGDFVRKSFFKEKRIEVIHNGTDLSIFRPLNNLRKSEDFNIIGVSSVWDDKKGLYDIFKLRKILDDNYRITLVGLSKKQVKQLPKGILGIERTQNVQELVKLYSDSDVLINPTYADNFPSVNIESLASGTPVITYKTGGSPEAIDGKTGIVVAQGDIKSLSESIVHLKENPLNSLDCRTRAMENFDKNKCFEKYIDLYNQLLAE